MQYFSMLSISNVKTFYIFNIAFSMQLIIINHISAEHFFSCYTNEILFDKIIEMLPYLFFIIRFNLIRCIFNITSQYLFLIDYMHNSTLDFLGLIHKIS